jgi:hypothetical protein
MNEKVQSVLNGILERFREPETLPRTIAYVTFPMPDLPSSSWSLMNRMIMFFSGSDDARGIRQWNQIGRYVKAGSKAIYILAPVIKTVKKDNDDEKTFLRGFKAIPVFRLEDTDGKPITYEAVELPELPLINKAEEWGITVKTAFYNERYLGCYSPSREEIRLASPDEAVFFHELAHAAHKRVLGGLKGGQDWRQEIVAELSAQALCYLVGKEPGRNLGNSYIYIERYAQKNKQSAIIACMRVLSEVEKVLKLILL